MKLITKYCLAGAAAAAGTAITIVSGGAGAVAGVPIMAAGLCLIKDSKKCPKCDAGLGLEGDKVKVCPKCKTKL